MVSLLPLNVNDRGIVTLGAKLGGIVVMTFLVHLSISQLFGLEEVQPVLNKLRQILFKPVRIQ